MLEKINVWKHSFLVYTEFWSMVGFNIVIPNPIYLVKIHYKQHQQTTRTTTSTPTHKGECTINRLWKSYQWHTMRTTSQKQFKNGTTNTQKVLHHQHITKTTPPTHNRDLTNIKEDKECTTDTQKVLHYQHMTRTAPSAHKRNISTLHNEYSTTNIQKDSTTKKWGGLHNQHITRIVPPTHTMRTAPPMHDKDCTTNISPSQYH